MTPRFKKLMAVIFLLPALTAYFFGAAALGELVPRFWLFRVVYFTFAGIAWALPVKYLIQWAHSDPKSANSINKAERSPRL